MSNNTKIKVLLVEDLEHMQDMVIRIFQRTCQDCELTIAATGEEALKSLEADKYDLIFMDIGLPDIDGTEVTSTIRSSPNINKNTPIIAFTAHSSFKSQYPEVGMDGFVDKVSLNIEKDIRQMIDCFVTKKTANSIKI